MTSAADNDGLANFWDDGSGEGQGEGEGEGEAETESVMPPGNVPLEMVWISAGTFMMGRYPGEQDSYDNEDPQHEVTLTRGFWMGKYEVTNGQWEALMGTTPWARQNLSLIHI